MCEVVSKKIALKKMFSQKTHCFPKKTIVFQHVHFFIPLFWNEKLSLVDNLKWDEMQSKGVSGIHNQ